MLLLHWSDLINSWLDMVGLDLPWGSLAKVFNPVIVPKIAYGFRFNYVIDIIVADWLLFFVHSYLIIRLHTNMYVRMRVFLINFYMFFFTNNWIEMKVNYKMNVT